MTFTGTKQQINEFLFKLEKETVYDIKIDKHRNKRSLDANNYAWKLITEISNVMKLSKEEVYLQFLKDYGQRSLIPILSNINPNDFFQYYEKVGVVKRNNNTFISYMVYKGTSKYNSKEMSIFIDGLTQEARSLGIQTLEDIEIERMIKEMEARENGLSR